jgi:hypothetical protein
MLYQDVSLLPTKTVPSLSELLCFLHLLYICHYTRWYPLGTRSSKKHSGQGFNELNYLNFFHSGVLRADEPGVAICC